MFWFDGSIKNAVDKVKSSGVLLLVFIKGNDKLSYEYDLKLSKESKIKPQELVAIKIDDNSVAFHHFQQIYVQVPVPSVFLIKSNGIPLKIVYSKNYTDLFDAIHVAIKNQSKFQKKNKVLDDHASQGFGNSDKSFEKTASRISHPKSIARIQFRFPNDDVLSWEFPDMSTLHDVRVYLMEKVNLSPNFKLLRVFPKTSFTTQDYNKTLKDLSLTPSGTLLIVPVQDKTVQAKLKNIIAQPSFVFIILKTLLLPFLTALKYFKKHVLGIQDESHIKPERLASETSMEKILNKKVSTSNIHGFQFDEDSDIDVEHPDSTQQRYEK